MLAHCHGLPVAEQSHDSFYQQRWCFSYCAESTRLLWKIPTEVNLIPQYWKALDWKKSGAWDKILFVKSVKAASLLRNILYQCYSGKFRLSVYYPVKTGMVFDNWLDHKHYVRYSLKTGKNIFHKQENVSDQVGNIRKPLLYWLNHKKN